MSARSQYLALLEQYARSQELSSEELDKMLNDLDNLWNSLTKDEKLTISSLDTLDD
jgi:hypothetical protein